ncbi:ECF-type sigma factor [Stieleria sp. ICT_E10.1]|jgi:RNA polymerase sigma factor (TIGR02999 family)|uniref:ECF-type sigma factor n=1 Tax=Stieleria sedimenti TaxID=2976331 RepID=UPI00217FE5EC|nr:ECF-type sigma factor [Stieleria sedimenti]MCS7470619.1 ECF-type sigma factor [Stieleria sedimenti]
MTDLTQILDDLALGQADATERLLPVVYEELRSMAGAMMRRERDDHTLQTTALVHEAYLRLVQQHRPEGWDGRGHFFSAAAEAMRRILVEHARRKLGKQRGGHLNQIDVDAIEEHALDDQSQSPQLVIEVDEAIDVLARQDPKSAELVKLKFFAGLSLVEAAELLGISKSTAYTDWAYAKAMLARVLDGA